MNKLLLYTKNSKKLFSIFLFLSLSLSTVFAATTTYVGPNYGDWNVYSYWSNGKPTSGKNAIIPSNKIVKYKSIVASYHITNNGSMIGEHGSNGQFYNLLITKGLTNNGYIECNGGILYLSGSTAITNNSSGYIKVNSGKFELYNKFTNYGTFIFNGSANGATLMTSSAFVQKGGVAGFGQYVNINGILNCENSGTLEFGAGATISYRLNVFNGVLNTSPNAQMKTTSFGKMTISSCGAAHILGSFNNQGKVQVNGGALYRKGSWSGKSPIYPKYETALFVYGNSSMNAGDAAIAQRLSAQGYHVTSIRDNQVATSHGSGKSLIVISNSASSLLTAPKFRSSSSPVVVFGASNMVNYYLSWVSYKDEYSNKIKMQTTHPIGFGLSNYQTIFNSSKTIEAATPYSSMTKIASLPSYANTAIMACPKNTVVMNGLKVNNRRVGLGFLATDALSFNSKGWTLFDDAVAWASTNCGDNLYLRSPDEGHDTSGEPSVDEQINIYPNPADDEVNIDFGEIYSPDGAKFPNGTATNISICNGLGMEVLRKTIENPFAVEQLNLSNLPAGPYYIFIDIPGKKPIVKKLRVTRMY